MTKKTVFIAAIMAVSLLAHWAQAGVSVVVNGSFEYDGPIEDITEYAPQRWCDVNLPEDQFGGAVWTDWPTDGYYNLALYSYIYAPFATGDMATVSQQVYLEDVNEISFDIKLDTWPSTKPWDPEKRSAVLLIDGEVVWDSTSLGTDDIKGEYFDQTYTVEDKYKFAGPHKLSLGIRANVGEGMSLIQYWAQWDFVKFDTHCDGFGYLPEDLNRDCYVEWLDLEMLAAQWLVEDPNEEYDLFQDDEDIVNFLDYLILANSWMGDSFGQEYKLLAADLNSDGIVDFGDLAELTAQWLWVGTPGSIPEDVFKDGTIDFADFAVLAEQWFQKNWLYGLE